MYIYTTTLLLLYALCIYILLLYMTCVYIYYCYRGILRNARRIAPCELKQEKKFWKVDFWKMLAGLRHANSSSSCAHSTRKFWEVSVIAQIVHKNRIGHWLSRISACVHSTRSPPPPANPISLLPLLPHSQLPSVFTIQSHYREYFFSPQECGLDNWQLPMNLGCGDFFLKK